MDFTISTTSKKNCMKFYTSSSDTGPGSSGNQSPSSGNKRDTRRLKKKRGSYKSISNSSILGRNYKGIHQSREQLNFNSSVSLESCDSYKYQCRRRAEVKRDKQIGRPVIGKFSSSSVNDINVCLDKESTNSSQSKYFDCQSNRDIRCVFSAHDSKIALGIPKFKTKRVQGLDLLSRKRKFSFSANENLVAEMDQEREFENRHDSIAGISEAGSGIRSLSSYSYSSLSTPEPLLPKNLLVRWLKPPIQLVISKIEDPRSYGGQIFKCMLICCS